MSCRRLISLTPFSSNSFACGFSSDPEAVRVGGVVILEAEVFSVFDAVALEQFVDFHSVPWRELLSGEDDYRQSCAGLVRLAEKDLGSLAKFAVE